MKHCRRCNLDYQADHRFCATCGGALEERQARAEASALCAACGGALRPEWKFCGHCRAPVARTATRPSPGRPVGVPAFAGPVDVSLTPCPSCHRPMEEGGGFCEHCGARVGAQTPPATAARVPDDEPEASTEAAQDDTGFDGAGGDAVETAPYDEETFDDEDDDAFDVDEEYEEVADEEVAEAGAASEAAPASDAVHAEAYEEAQPVEGGPRGEVQSEGPRANPYGEPRSFGYGQPLPTFGLDEEVAEKAEVPRKGAGRNRLIILGGAGLAAVLLVVAGAVLLRPSPQTGEPAPAPAPARTNAANGDNGAPSQPAPPEGMVYVPGGKFLMGRDSGDDYERPAHEVSVAPFFIDKYEVTREDYQKFVAATGRVPRGWAGGKFPEGTGRLPVTGVSWADAVAYAQWAGKRLPTEAEWEYAARGADGRLYPWGNEWQGGLANADSSARKGMAPVGEFRGASPFGLFDLVGNAWEWTSSELEAYPGGRLPPQERRDLRVIRGGSWQSDRSAATTTYRWGWPAEGAEDYGNTSFRCAKDVAAAK